MSWPFANSMITVIHLFQKEDLFSGHHSESRGSLLKKKKKKLSGAETQANDCFAKAACYTSPLTGSKSI